MAQQQTPMTPRVIESKYLNSRNATLLAEVNRLGVYVREADKHLSILKKGESKYKALGEHQACIISRRADELVAVTKVTGTESYAINTVNTFDGTLKTLGLAHGTVHYAQNLEAQDRSWSSFVAGNPVTAERSHAVFHLSEGTDNMVFHFEYKGWKSLTFQLPEELVIKMAGLEKQQNKHHLVTAAYTGPFLNRLVISTHEDPFNPVHYLFKYDRDFKRMALLDIKKNHPTFKIENFLVIKKF